METQKTSNSQSNPDRRMKLEESHSQTSDYTTMVQQSKKSMLLAQKQTYRSTEQDRRPRNKLMHLWPINLQGRRQEYIMENSLSNKVVLGKLDSHM